MPVIATVCTMRSATEPSALCAPVPVARPQRKNGAFATAISTSMMPRARSGAMLRRPWIGVGAATEEGVSAPGVEVMRRT